MYEVNETLARDRSVDNQAIAGDHRRFLLFAVRANGIPAGLFAIRGGLRTANGEQRFRGYMCDLCKQGVYYLNEGETWKIGYSCNPDRRYKPELA
jgi:hypothetical protein